MEAAGLLGILGWCSICDIKNRTIQTGVLLMAGIIGVGLHMLYGRISVWDMLGGMAVGGIVFLFAHFSGEKIGKGDAFLIMICGLFLGLWQTLLLVWVSLMLAGLMGMVMLLKGKGRKYEMPFIPFLLTGYIICLAMLGGKIA